MSISTSFRLKVLTALSLTTVLLIQAVICTSCQQDACIKDAKEASAIIYLHVKSEQQTDATTRVEENLIKDLHILIYDSNGNLIGQKYTTNNTVTINTHSATDCTIYAIANTGTPELFNSYDIHWENNLKNKTYSLYDWNNLTKNNVLPMTGSQSHVLKKPGWLKIRLHRTPEYAEVQQIVDKHALHTICSSGMCPNKAECWSRRTATFMILGDICTRGCRFCATKTGHPLAPDAEEPRRVAESVALMKLRYVVVTSVTRDDLPDGGAAHWAQTVRAIRTQNPDAVIELLIPDLDAQPAPLDVVVASKPDIIGHNIETVERLTPVVRSKAKYRTSLETLRYLSAQGVATKSGLMVGLGESDDEVLQTLHDLRDAGVGIVTLGQYLRPTLEHYPVAAYITPEKFEWYRLKALEMGFSYCASAPLVRSSYMAEEALKSVKSL